MFKVLIMHIKYIGFINTIKTIMLYKDEKEDYDSLKEFLEDNLSAAF